MLKFIKVGLPLLLAVTAVLGSRPVFAHGFGERTELPVPLGIFLIGAGLTVALSFAVIGFFLKGSPGGSSYGRYNLFKTPVAGIGGVQSIYLVAGQAVFGVPAGVGDSRRTGRGPDLVIQFCPNLRLDHLVGWPGVFRGFDREPVGPGQPLESLV